MMKIGDTVTHVITRDTQHIEPGRRYARGTVKELDTIENFPCALVAWEWGGTFWKRCNLLTVIDPAPTPNTEQTQ